MPISCKVATMRPASMGEWLETQSIGQRLGDFDRALLALISRCVEINGHLVDAVNWLTLPAADVLIVQNRFLRLMGLAK